VIHLEQAPSNRDAKPGESFGTQGNIAANRNQHDFTQYFVVSKNGFRAISVAVTAQWIEPPFHQSGRHKHLEAVVYAVEGKGYTELNGKQIPWEAGDVLFVPPAMWEHQHGNESGKAIKQLRIGFGIRPWITSLWPEGFSSQRIMDEQGNPIEAGRIVRKRERTR
jgi:uncharacterized RmlC-like cupin family protein